MILSDTHTRRHRWMVAVPAALLIVSLTLREGYLREPVHSAADAPSWAGGDVRPDSGATIEIVDDETVRLEQGGLLLVTPSLATVLAGPWEVHVWGGSVYVTVRQDRVTVAALETPVLVNGEAGMAVVEPYSQWRAPDALPDPSLDPVGWLDAQTQTVQPLPEHFRAEQEERARSLRAGMSETVQPLPPAADVLARTTTPELALAALRSRPSPELAAAVRTRPVLRAYGPLHPAFHDVAWAYAPAGPDPMSWPGLLLLPRLEHDDDSTSSLTVRKWGEALRAAIDASTSSGALRTAILSALKRDVRSLADAGHPLRALRFAEALRGAVGTGTLLTDEARDALAYLSSLTPETLRASVLPQALSAPVAAPVSSPRPGESETVDPDPALEQRARDALVARGGMFTTRTTIRTTGRGTVEVKDAVFGFPSGDRALRFEFTVDADTVRAIVDGIVQPYELTLERYLEWEAGR